MAGLLAPPSRRLCGRRLAAATTKQRGRAERPLTSSKPGALGWDDYTQMKETTDEQGTELTGNRSRTEVACLRHQHGHHRSPPPCPDQAGRATLPEIEKEVALLGSKQNAVDALGGVAPAEEEEDDDDDNYACMNLQVIK
uniref:Uncharacterized protein n=1 Tax=Oryza punctata TaxID=4537 RepID=A0A0E0MHY0_ORYPU